MEFAVLVKGENPQVQGTERVEPYFAGFYSVCRQHGKEQAEGEEAEKRISSRKQTLEEQKQGKAGHNSA